MKKQWGITFFLMILAFFLGSSLMYFLMIKFPANSNKTYVQEMVSTDDAITQAVDKLYNSVVVIEVYNNNNKVISTGSGFVYKKKDNIAYILTNNHVLANGVYYYVTFSDGRKELVNLVGKDEYSDVAVLSIDSSKVLLVSKISTSVDVKIGDTVFAIGTPMSSKYYGSVTRGIISGKDRLVEVKNNNGENFVVRVLQTDAAINSGNSGGPLANSNGEVIGMTSAKLLANEAEGIGFALPIEEVLKYAKNIENNEEIIRPEIGISFLETSDVVNLKNLEIYLPVGVEGLIVMDIKENSIFSNSPIKVNDIITKIDGNEVTSVYELNYYVHQHKIGDDIEITYIKDNKESLITVTLK